MTDSGKNPPERIRIPPRQQPVVSAREKAVEALISQTAAQLAWLGAEPAGDRWRLRVMNRDLRVDLQSGQIDCDDGRDVPSTWNVLVLHYLAVTARPLDRPPDVTFASFPSARTYAVVYENRVNRRLCATVGRDRPTLLAAATTIGARPVEGGDLAFELDALPRIPVRLIWYARDEELPPSCTLLLPDHIESYLCTEDVVVLSESLVSYLQKSSLPGPD